EMGKTRSGGGVGVEGQTARAEFAVADGQGVLVGGFTREALQENLRRNISHRTYYVGGGRIPQDAGDSEITDLRRISHDENVTRLDVAVLERGQAGTQIVNGLVEEIDS